MLQTKLLGRHLVWVSQLDMMETGLSCSHSFFLLSGKPLLTYFLPRTRTSETFRIFIVFFLGLGIYNACVIIASALFYFKHYRGLYFWSLVTAGWGIIPYCVGFLIKFMNIVTGKGIWIAAVLVTMGKSVNPPPTPCG